MTAYWYNEKTGETETVLVLERTMYSFYIERENGERKTVYSVEFAD